MSAIASAIPAPAPAPRQAWILSPAQDTLFVVAAPLLALGAAIAAFAFLGAADATAYIVLLHIVFTVAHHLPTFIRVYGDTDLFRRFKWTFVLAPVFPLGFAAAALAYLNAHDYADRERAVSLGAACALGPVALPDAALRLHAHLRPPQRGAEEARGAHGSRAVGNLVRVHHARERRVAREHPRGSVSHGERAARGRAPERRDPGLDLRGARRGLRRDRRVRRVPRVVPAAGLRREPREARAVRDDVRRDVHRLHAEPVDPVVGAGLDVRGRLRRDRRRPHDAVPRDRVALQPQPRCATRACTRRRVSRAAPPRRLARRRRLRRLVPRLRRRADEPTREPLADVGAARARLRVDAAALLLRRLHLEAAPPAEPRELGTRARRRPWHRRSRDVVVEHRARALAGGRARTAGCVLRRAAHRF